MRLLEALRNPLRVSKTKADAYNGIDADGRERMIAWHDMVLILETGEIKASVHWRGKNIQGTVAVLERLGLISVRVENDICGNPDYFWIKLLDSEPGLQHIGPTVEKVVKEIARKGGKE
jgi:hypothetical protein